MSNGAWSMLGSIAGIVIFMIISVIFFLKGKGASFVARCNNISEEEARDRCRSGGRVMVAFSFWLLFIHAVAFFLKALWPIFCGIAVVILLSVVDIVCFVRNKKPWFYSKLQ
jgi:hypothetical protein